MEITANRITTADGVGGYLAYPKGQKSPGMVVHFEIFGVNGHISALPVSGHPPPVILHLAAQIPDNSETTMIKIPRTLPSVLSPPFSLFAWIRTK